MIDEITDLEQKRHLTRLRRALRGLWKQPRFRRGLWLVALALLITVQTLIRTVVMNQPPAVTLLPLPYQYIPSPNFGERPPNTEITAVVVHATVEPTTQGTVDIFLNPKTQVSAHFVVGRDGQVIQMVPLEKRAWHAGVSTLEGKGNLNDYSVGIEMVNLNDGVDPYPEAQVQAVAGIIRFLRSHCAIPDNHIVSHAEIALPKGRKSDPLGFDFERLRALCRLTPDNAGPPPQPSNLTPVTANPPIKR